MEAEPDGCSTKKIRLNEFNQEPSAAAALPPVLKTIQTQNPLDIPEIVQKVLKLLDNSNLKSCRLVNRRWNENSCKILSTRENLYIHLRNFHHVDVDPMVMSKNYKPEEDLSCENLTKYFDSPPHKIIPCQNVCISSGDFYHDLYEFLKSHGSHIFRLRLECEQILHYVNQRLMGYLRRLLTRQTTNIKFLEIQLSHHVHVFEFGDSKRHRSKLFPVRWTTELPNLKKFRVTNVQMLHIGNEIIKEILTAAINLEEFEAVAAPRAAAPWGSRWLTVDYIDELIVSKKLHTVKTAAVAPTPFPDDEEAEELIEPIEEGYTKNSKLQKFAKAQHPPKLHTLVLHLDQICGFPSYYDNATEIIQKILHTSDETLHSISLEPMEFLSNLTFPILKNVRQLSLSARSLRFERTKLFPMDQTLLQIFPNLTRIILEPEQEYWCTQDYLQTEIPVPSVTELTLRIQSYPCEPFLRILAKLFPNLNRLVINPSPGGRRDLPLVLKAIGQNFSKLQNLSINNFWIDCEDREALQKQIFQLDEAVTGIPMDELKEGKILAGSSDDDHKSWPVDSLISQNPGLAFLTMEIKMGSWSEFAKNGVMLNYPLFWTGRHVFGVIPNVKIIFVGNVDEGDWGVCSHSEFYSGAQPLRALLEHIKPYVEIKMEKLLVYPFGKPCQQKNPPTIIHSVMAEDSDDY